MLLECICGYFPLHESIPLRSAVISLCRDCTCCSRFVLYPHCFSGSIPFRPGAASQSRQSWVPVNLLRGWFCQFIPFWASIGRLVLRAWYRFSALRWSQIWVVTIFTLLTCGNNLLMSGKVSSPRCWYVQWSTLVLEVVVVTKLPILQRSVHCV